MATLNGINIHHSDVITAKALRENGVSWLEVTVGKTWPVTINMFMSFDAAQIYAEGIRSANAAHEQMIEEEAQYEAARRAKHIHEVA